jgi:hypothetical protein
MGMQMVFMFLLLDEFIWFPRPHLKWIGAKCAKLPKTK